MTPTMARMKKPERGLLERLTLQLKALAGALVWIGIVAVLAFTAWKVVCFLIRLL